MFYLHSFCLKSSGSSEWELCKWISVCLSLLTKPRTCEGIHRLNVWESTKPVWLPHLVSKLSLNSIVRNLSVGCASSCGDTSTQTIATTSHLGLSFTHLYSLAFMLLWFHIFGLFILLHWCLWHLLLHHLGFYFLHIYGFFVSLFYLLVHLSLIHFYTHSNFHRSRSKLDTLIFISTIFNQSYH